MSVIDELAERLANIPTLRQISLTSENREERNMALPQIHVRDYLDLIPSFDGEPSKLSKFLDACEKVLPLMAPGNEPTRIMFTMLHIRNKIIGKASDLISAREFQTFPELKNLLISLFGDQRNEESLLADLNTLRQRSKETPLQFADRCINLRSLLLSKLSCANSSVEIKQVKTQLYNNSTLRAFLTGTNEQLSHLLRCKNPQSIEEAIQMVIDEENINYHRSRIMNTPQQTTNAPQQAKPTHQLRINPPPRRTIPNFQSIHQPPHQNQTFRHPFQQPNWIPKPFQTRPQFFPQQAHSSQMRPQHNVFQPKNKPPTNTPTPMDVDSNRSRLSNQSKFQQRMAPQQRSQPLWKIEELHTQIENTDQPENDYQSPEEYYSYENDQYYRDEYENVIEQEEPDYENENANFPTLASETTTPKQN